MGKATLPIAKRLAGHPQRVKRVFELRIRTDIEEAIRIFTDMEEAIE